MLASGCGDNSSPSVASRTGGATVAVESVPFRHNPLFLELVCLTWSMHNHADEGFGFWAFGFGRACGTEYFWSASD
jgi:hypothetical protein